MKTLKIICRVCSKPHFLKVHQEDYVDWQDGSLIQSVMPYLSPDERELLISGTCGDCFRSMFENFYAEEKPTSAN